MTQHESGGTVDTCGLTDRGKVREVNEDQFFVASLTKTLNVMHTSLEELGAFEHVRKSEAHLFVVADGVGTVGGGRLASGTAIQALVTYIGRTIGCYYSYDVDSEQEFIEQLEAAIEHTHNAVIDMFSSKGKGPATTLTMAVLLWPRLYFIHVGDSRAYHLRQGRLRQITRDQTMGEMMIDQGIMTEEQVSRSSLSNTLASAIGAEIRPATGLIDLKWGDTLLLCTDGLTRHVSDEQLAAILQRTESAEDGCRQLVDAALEGGGRDNITAVVTRAVGS